MLSAEQEKCPPRRSRFWLSAKGHLTFHRMVERLAPNEEVDAESARVQLLSALQASDFAEPHEVEERVHSAARVLAERVQAATLRIARHHQFVTQPQPFRPDVVYGEADAPATRDSLSNNISATPRRDGFFAQYLAQQRALAEGRAARGV